MNISKSTVLYSLIIIILVPSIIIGLVLPSVAKDKVQDDNTDQSITTNMIVFGVFAGLGLLLVVWYMVCHAKSKVLKELTGTSYSTGIGAFGETIKAPLGQKSTESILFSVMLVCLFIYGLAGSIGSWGMTRKKVNKESQTEDVKNAQILLFVGMIFQVVSVLVVTIIGWMLWRCISGTGYFRNTLRSKGDAISNAFTRTEKPYTEGSLAEFGVTGDY